MVVKNIINDMLPSIWPMVLFISVVFITIRGAYLLKGSRKFVLYKELFILIFVIYILCLYYILMGQYGSIKGVNYIPFKGIFSYKFGSYKFIRNILFNSLIFVPFGYFASYYLNNRKISVISLVTLIVSASACGIQYYLHKVFEIDYIILNWLGGFCGYLIYIGLSAIRGKLPKFMKSDIFANIVVIILLILIVIFSCDIDVLKYLK